MPPDLTRRVPIEHAAREAQCTRQQMLERIRRMEALGVRVNNQWYVERPLVVIVCPDQPDYTTAILRLYLCRNGQFLLARQRFSIDTVLQQELSVTLLYFEIKAMIKIGKL